MEGVAALALVDTGTTVSVITESLCRKLQKITTPLSALALWTANSQCITSVAACTACIVIQGYLYTVEFVVLSSGSYNVILGWDFLCDHQAVIDCSRAKVEFPPPCDIRLHVLNDLDDHDHGYHDSAALFGDCDNLH